MEEGFARPNQEVSSSHLLTDLRRGVELFSGIGDVAMSRGPGEDSTILSQRIPDYYQKSPDGMFFCPQVSGLWAPLSSKRHPVL